ncbi:pilus assembly PilX family protein [Pseudomonas benzopyrenica]|uniref:pilus assembly PilX family protein n=1 Tax=Pseudomonas benzopyrenica TaxID=2993566 RepID=UPI0039C06A72
MNQHLSAQRGAVLIVTLVMLLLLTLLALGSMRGTTLEERMAGNLRDESQAFQAAEMGQRLAETWANTTSIAALQNMTATRTVTINPPDLQPTTYSIVPLPGVTLRTAGVDMSSGKPITTSVIRIISKGQGAAQDISTAGANQSSTSAASSSVEISTLYIRR